MILTNDILSDLSRLGDKKIVWNLIDWQILKKKQVINTHGDMIIHVIIGNLFILPKFLFA